MATASLRLLGSPCSFSLEAQGIAAATGLSRDGSGSSIVYCVPLGSSNSALRGTQLPKSANNVTVACQMGLSRVSVTGGGRGELQVRAMRASGGDRKEEKRTPENIPSSPPPPLTSTNSISVEGEGGIEKDDQLVAETIARESGITESSQYPEGERGKAVSDSADSMDEIGTAISELRKERAAIGLQDSSSTTDFWRGVTEETRLIDWPVFSKVLGTTGVVVAMILGSSVVLLTVNAVLAASSDFIFNDPAIKEFAKTQLNLSF